MLSTAAKTYFNVYVKCLPLNRFKQSPYLVRTLNQCFCNQIVGYQLPCVSIFLVVLCYIFLIHLCYIFLIHLCYISYYICYILRHLNEYNSHRNEMQGFKLLDLSFLITDLPLGITFSYLQGNLIRNMPSKSQGTNHFTK